MSHFRHTQAASASTNTQPPSPEGAEAKAQSALRQTRSSWSTSGIVGLVWRDASR